MLTKANTTLLQSSPTKKTKTKTKTNTSECNTKANGNGNTAEAEGVSNERGSSIRGSSSTAVFGAQEERSKL
jgi:hypothetical protein